MQVVDGRSGCVEGRSWKKSIFIRILDVNLSLSCPNMIRDVMNEVIPNLDKFPHIEMRRRMKDNSVQWLRIKLIGSDSLVVLGCQYTRLSEEQCYANVCLSKFESNARCHTFTLAIIIQNMRRAQTGVVCVFNEKNESKFLMIENCETMKQIESHLSH